VFEIRLFLALFAGFNFIYDGLQVIAVAKSSDVVLMVLDASKVHMHTLQFL